MNRTGTPAPGWIPVTSHRGPRTLDLPAEPTTTPGLAITPAWRGATWTGRHVVVHTASGRTVPHTELPLVYAREVADHLGRAIVDWTLPVEVLWPDRLDDRAPVTSLVIEVTDAAVDAWRGGIPLEWGRSSWQACPPLWRLHGYTDLTDDGPMLSTIDSDPAWTTWAGAAGWLDLFDDNPFHEPPADTVTVVRDAELSWRLVCAAPRCHGSRPTEAGWFDAYGDWVERPTTDRDFLARTARDFGWRQHGRHWLCPSCAYDYRPSYDTFWW